MSANALHHAISSCGSSMLQNEDKNCPASGPFARAVELIAEAKRQGFALGDHSVPGRAMRGEAPTPHAAYRSAALTLDDLLEIAREDLADEKTAADEWAVPPGKAA